PALALVPCPKQRHLWATSAHRGTLGTLDEFKAAWKGRLTHHGDTPKILPGNLSPAAVAHWWISLEPYPPSCRNWLGCNLAYRIEWHSVLQKMHAGPHMRDPDCGDGPPQPAPCVPDTLNIPDVGTAYLKYTCKDAAKYLRCSR